MHRTGRPRTPFPASTVVSCGEHPAAAAIGAAQPGLPGNLRDHPARRCVGMAGGGVQVTPLAYVGVFIFVIAGWLVSLCLHEFGHAYPAWRYGDHDVAVRGYLTLNPLKYSNPLLSIGCPCCSSRSAASGCRAARCTCAPVDDAAGGGRPSASPGRSRTRCWRCSCWC